MTRKILSTCLLILAFQHCSSRKSRETVCLCVMSAAWISCVEKLRQCCVTNVLSSDDPGCDVWERKVAGWNSECLWRAGMRPLPDSLKGTAFSLKISHSVITAVIERHRLLCVWSRFDVMHCHRWWHKKCRGANCVGPAQGAHCIAVLPLSIARKFLQIQLSVFHSTARRLPPEKAFQLFLEPSSQCRSDAAC